MTERCIEMYMPDLRANPEIATIHYPEEYAGQQTVKLCCTQHYNAFYRPDITDYQQKKITESWVKFLHGDIQPMEVVQFCTKTNQAVFDAICHQENVQSLWFKWCAVPDLSQIAQLRKLKRLYIGLGTAIRDLSPLGELENLEVLRLGNTSKVTDYSALGRLRNLKALEIVGYDTLNPVTIKAESDAFLQQLDRLEFTNLNIKVIK